MTNELVVLSIYSTPLILVFAIYFLRRKKIQRQSHQFLTQAQQDGLTEAASLHPVIDPVKCLGCGSCVTACPEHDVIGMIDRYAQLVNPANCIGHGACKEACPTEAITLVFGNATRGVDIPELTPEFETNVSGMFIAGELGGMGLIKNAIEQGRQAMDSVERYVNKFNASNSDTTKDLLDCVVVGAGPAGISAMLGAKEKKLNIQVIDQDSAGGTVSHFPKGKLVMTAPAHLPLVGKVKFSEISKEKLMAFWLELIEKHQLKINQNEEMTNVERHDDGTFTLTSSKNTYHSKSILLAIGRRGSPRKLGVEGEHLAKVVYRLVDPDQYQQQQVLVVGGGDSALEAACSIADNGTCDVTISYRSDSFNRAKQKNRERVQRLVEQNKITLVMSSQVTKITETEVHLKTKDEELVLPNSVIIVCAGGILPTPFLKKIGIEVTTKYGTV
jgi:thioredoxin reductase/NAD-dependent dihydropyrimidine dehydrogenase PreA subunit